MTLSGGILYFLNKRSIWIGLFSLSIVTCGFALHPSYQAFKSWRSEKIYTNSKTLIKEKAYLRGFERAKAAVLLDPSNLKAARHLAELSLLYQHPQAFNYCELVLKSDQVSDEDWGRAIDAALQSENTKSAFSTLNRWQSIKISNTAAFAIRKVHSFLAIEEYSVAYEILEEARSEHPQSDEIYDLFLALLQFVGSRTAIQAVTAEILESHPPANKHLKWVSKQAALPAEVRLQALEALQTQASLTLNDRIKFLLSAHRLGNVKAKTQILANYKRAAISDKKTLAVYTTALCEVGLYDQVLSLIPDSSQNRILQRNRLFAAIETGQLEEAFEYSTLDRSQRLTSVAEETLLRALAFLKSGDQIKHENSLQQSIAAAELPDLPFLSQQFQRLGYTDTLLALYERLSSHADYGYQIHQLWLKLALAARNEASLARCIASFPTSHLANYPPKERTPFLYYCLVFNQHSVAVSKEVEELAATFPYEPSYQSLLAFSEWKEGNYDQAKTLISNIPNTPTDKTYQLARSLIYGITLEGKRDHFLAAELHLLSKGPTSF